MLAEATTAKISKEKNPKTLDESKVIAKQGGTIAGNTRKEIERQNSYLRFTYCFVGQSAAVGLGTPSVIYQSLLLYHAAYIVVGGNIYLELWDYLTGHSERIKRNKSVKTIVLASVKLSNYINWTEIIDFGRSSNGATKLIIQN